MDVRKNFVKWCTFHCKIKGFRSSFKRNNSISNFEKTWGIFIVPGPVETKWKLDLVLFETKSKETFLKYTFRSISKKGCYDISAHIRFGLHDAKGNCVYASSIFESVDICSGIIAFTEFSQTSDSSGSLLDFFMVNCEAYVFVTFVNMPENIYEFLFPKHQRRRSESENIRSLSKDMKTFYKSEQETDLVINLKDGQIKAHKTILCARSRFFSNILQEENKTFIELQDAEKGVMDKLLSFIYSGNLEELSTDDYSPFKLQEYAQRFRVEEITRFFKFQKHISSTKLLQTEVDFKWSIKNFSQYEGSLTSPDFQSSDDSATYWSMALSFGLERTLNIGVIMRSNEDSIFENVNCTVSLLDRYGRRSYERSYIVPRMFSLNSPTRLITFYSLFQRDDLTRFTKGDRLNLQCSLKYAVKSTFSFTEGACAKDVTRRLLSEKDFLNYYTRGLLSGDGCVEHDTLGLLRLENGYLKSDTHGLLLEGGCVKIDNLVLISEECGVKCDTLGVLLSEDGRATGSTLGLLSEDKCVKFNTSGLLSADGCVKYDTLGLLSEDYGMLLKKGTHSDVVLIVGSREFEVHRAVLSARSAVFSEMFHHDMFEENTEVVLIEVIQDMEADVVEALLHFIYTGNVDRSLLTKKSDELIYAADKYAIMSLTEACVGS